MLLARGATDKNMTLLFGGLETSAAGDVITSLDQRGVAYDVRGGAIYVDAALRDSLRLTLASEGLPASAGQGYELLDGLSGFGTTSQMFDAAYWRAKEGELARTILASPHIRSARVHISTPSTRGFQRDQKPTAAVTVTTAAGSLSAPHVRALQYLIGSAVSGLSPENVAIIDGDGGLMSDNEGNGNLSGSEDRADALRKRAERLLEARVGFGNAVVEVSMDTVTETESITERHFDPEGRVAISSEVSESTGKSQDSPGDVTVASNLPAGDAGSNGTSNNENSETRSLTNYEVSETQRQILRAPGAVRRLTVAVLVNNVSSVATDGTATVTPRSPEELDALRELVSSAVGFDESRGDIITLKSMDFEPIASLGTAVDNPTASSPLNVMRLIQLGVLALVALILGLFVVRPILLPGKAPAALPPPAPNGDVTAMNQTNAIGQLSPNGGLLALEHESASDEDPVSRLRKMISERETETIQILQDWMEEPETTEKA